MNTTQRAILTVAGALLLLVAFVQGVDDTGSGWIALISFALSVGCFVLAASRRQ